MFFTNFGRVIAWLAVVSGIARIGLGVLVVGGSEELAARYLGSTTSGEAIDRGLMVMVFGICLGILVEISLAVRKVACSTPD